MSSSLEFVDLDEEALYIAPPAFVETQKGAPNYCNLSIRQAVEAPLSFMNTTVRFSSHFNFSVSCVCFSEHQENPLSLSFSLIWTGRLLNRPHLPLKRRLNGTLFDPKSLKSLPCLIVNEWKGEWWASEPNFPEKKDGVLGSSRSHFRKKKQFNHVQPG